MSKFGVACVWVEEADRDVVGLAERSGVTPFGVREVEGSDRRVLRAEAEPGDDDSAVEVDGADDSVRLVADLAKALERPGGV